MGGKYADLAAVRCRGLSAVVSWYGMLRADAIDEANPEHALDALAQLRCPLLAFFGADDVLIPQKDVDELRSRARERALPVEIVVYDGGGSRIRERFASRGLPRRSRSRRLDPSTRVLHSRARELTWRTTQDTRRAPSAAARGGALQATRRRAHEPKASEVN